jgi:hypothetical protein
MRLSWNEVFRWRQTLARPSVGHNKKPTFIRPVDPSLWYHDNVLAPRVVPHFDNHALADRPMFMDDNARPHRARIVQHFLQQEAVQTIPWPENRLSSDQWTRLYVRIVHPKWSCNQSNQAWRWRFMGCRAPGLTIPSLYDWCNVFVKRVMFSDCPRAGRPRKTTPREDRLVSQVSKYVCTGNENSKPIWNKFIIRKDIIETRQVVLNFCRTVYIASCDGFSYYYRFFRYSNYQC